MIVTELPTNFTLPPPRQERGKGVHLSGIIRCIATEEGILKPEWAEELSLLDVRSITDPVAILRISIGLAWEEWYIPTILGPVMGVMDHPGEMEVDGVYMTHDGESLSSVVADRSDVNITPLVLMVHEVKATYKRTNTVKDLRDQWMWIAQVKGYCKGLGTRFAVVHVLFLCGDYSYPIKPQLRVWQLEFTQEEIDTNWDLLMEYKQYRLKLEAEN